MLKSEKNTPAIENKISEAFLEKYGHLIPEEETMNTVFEHGHWWIQFYNFDDEQKIFSVVDAEGIGTINEFDFEEIQ